jgi:hypothetical protein
MGLFDRLAYKNPREIPRNWEMTSMDAARIKAKTLSTPLSIESHPENPVSIPRLGAEGTGKMKDIMEPETSPPSLLQSDALVPFPGPSKKQRYSTK